MTDKGPIATDGVGGSMPLASAVDLGAWHCEALLDMPMLAPAPVHVIDQTPLSDILADALISEPVDISDLLPVSFEPATDEVFVPMLEASSDEPGLAGDLIDLPDAFFMPTVTLSSLLDDSDKGHIAL
ncbi:hypothetical protein [Aminobacter aminovorans]|uniref:hypothetical protein n=1 Tax=Aminobacter aminovorans TaxID=83263 RepID=UPI002861C1F7|nr:hypothetical protein [Aminobacter aminovorans]MDR7222694.1 hypothetical protein [Aminobacter aminovorans]